MIPQTDTIAELRNASELVAQSVGSIMSTEIDSILRQYRTDYSKELCRDSAQIISDNLIYPFRSISDRGGKSWRSHIMFSACEAVGGDKNQLIKWLGIIEILHVGSLIIDDIQDNSTKRRGGITCHHEFGQSLAINAGNNAYFMFDQLVENLKISDENKLKLYKLYFQTLRGAHAGQGMDIKGLKDLALKCLKNDSYDDLENASLEIHRLKTGLPVSLCLLIGAIAGGANEEQLKRFSQFGEAMGIAFQIGDDILNIHGFKNDLKVKGEDIAEGKLTIPFIKSLENLTCEERKKAIMKITDDSPKNHMDEILEYIEKGKGVENSLCFSKELIKNSWRRLNLVLPETKAKHVLYKFANYFLEQQY